MQVIPAIDVLGGKVVRLRQGDYDQVAEYGDDPVSVAEQFIAEGATLVHVVDLDAARGRERSVEVIRSLGRAGIGFQLGGGIRSAEIATEVIELGARRVVIGSALLADGDAAGDIVRAVGPDAVVAAIDVRGGRAHGSGWLDDGVPVADVVEFVADLGVGRALVTAIEQDGTMEGPALELLATVRSLAPDLALIASGGVGSLADIRKLRDCDAGVEAVIVGRALYEGRFTLPEAAVLSLSRSSRGRC